MSEAAMVADVRRFNRAVTVRAGALNQRYLASDLTLGEARLLWEIGRRKDTELRSLRSRLQLDSGYLTRLLAGLEQRGLVAIRTSQRDRRVRCARLTRGGRTLWRTLDRRSDRLAESILAPLQQPERERLVTAMREVERLLVAAELRIEPEDPASEVARFCVESYFAELSRRSNGGFDRNAAISAEPHELVPPHGGFLLGWLHGEPIGCGAVKFHPGAAAEIKRMWVAEDARGLGVGRRLLVELERLALESGAQLAHIETSDLLSEAVALYRSAGYVEVPPFNEEPFADRWFEKRLAAR